MFPRILFIKIDWLDRYQGEDPPPTIFGPGALCGERFNFKPFDGGVFGAVPKGQRFGLAMADRHPWLVIWIAKPPAANPGNHQSAYRPAGWYEQATLLEGNRDRPEYAHDPAFPNFGQGRFQYTIHAAAKDAYLIPAERRQSFPEIPTKPVETEPTRFGNTMILYARCPGRFGTWRERYASIAEEIASRRNSADRCDQLRKS
jgi:hypothetical protein